MIITEQFPVANIGDLTNRNSDVSIRGVPRYTFWYLASPYAKYATGKRDAYESACEYAHDLIVAGVPVFSPIAHSHSIAKVCRMDKDSHDLWMPQDLAILAGANGVLIAPMAGWRTSKGIAMEIEEAKRLSKPVYMLDLHW